MAFIVLVSFGPMLFCLVRGAVDVAQRRYRWGVAGVLCGLLALLFTLFGPTWPDV
jgi:hypothetical protein